MTDNAVTAGSSGTGFTIKAMLMPLLTHPRVARIIKYTVYISLVVNFGLYFIQDYRAYLAALPPDASWKDILEQFSTSVDMAAWLGLVFLFELETYALPDEAFKGWVTKFLHIGRLVCYVSIGLATYGYTAESLENYDVDKLAGINSICQLADQDVWLQQNVYRYEQITSSDCASMTDETVFYQVRGEVSVVGAETLQHNRFMGWIDVVNAVAWLVVVFLIEIEIWLQNNDRFSSRMLPITRHTKTFFYLILIADGVIWAFNGYVLYSWDAFLWIFGFWAIELNLAEWERDRLVELQGDLAAPA